MRESDALEYLSSAGRFGELGLGRTVALLRALGDPQTGMRFYHVAGTNGKGSVTAAIAQMLCAEGVRAGRFISPHLERPHERVWADGSDIAGEDIAAEAERVRRAARSMADPPTEFELWTALALCHFQSKGVTHVAWETGLGGRFDATNVVDPEVSVITGIAFDHQDRLGGSLAEIAWQKAGIVKPGRPVVVGDLPLEAMAVVEEVAGRQGAPIWRWGREIDTALRSVDRTGTTFRYKDPLGEIPLVRTELLGAHQAHNTALALAALRMGTGVAATPLWLPALRRVRWPGRFELLEGDPLVVLDGAHNPQGSQALWDTWRGIFSETRPVVLFGCLAKRDPRDIWAPLREIAASLHTATPPSPRALPAEESARALGGTPHATIEGALEDALREARDRRVPLLACGSLYLIGEVRSALRRAGRIGQSEG